MAIIKARRKLSNFFIVPLLGNRYEENYLATIGLKFPKTAFPFGNNV